MRGFGELEARLMAALWRLDRPATIHEVLDELDGRKVAYTTAITVIERLREKGWLTREREGRSFRYSTTKDEGEYTAHLMATALGESNDRSAALLSFAERLEPGELDELRRHIVNGADRTSASGSH